MDMKDTVGNMGSDQKDVKVLGPNPAAPTLLTGGGPTSSAAPALPVAQQPPSQPQPSPVGRNDTWPAADKGAVPAIYPSASGNPDGGTRQVAASNSIADPPALQQGAEGFPT